MLYSVIFCLQAEYDFLLKISLKPLWHNKKFRLDPLNEYFKSASIKLMKFSIVNQLYKGVPNDINQIRDSLEDKLNAFSLGFKNEKINKIYLGVVIVPSNVKVLWSVRKEKFYQDSSEIEGEFYVDCDAFLDSNFQDKEALYYSEVRKYLLKLLSENEYMNRLTSDVFKKEFVSFLNNI